MYQTERVSTIVSHYQYTYSSNINQKTVYVQPTRSASSQCNLKQETGHLDSNFSGFLKQNQNAHTQINKTMSKMLSKIKSLSKPKVECHHKKQSSVQISLKKCQEQLQRFKEKMNNKFVSLEKSLMRVKQQTKTQCNRFSQKMTDICLKTHLWNKKLEVKYGSKKQKKSKVVEELKLEKEKIKERSKEKCVPLYKNQTISLKKSKRRSKIQNNSLTLEQREDSNQFVKRNKRLNLKSTQDQNHVKVSQHQPNLNRTDDKIRKNECNQTIIEQSNEKSQRNREMRQKFSATFNQFFFFGKKIRSYSQQ